MGKSTKFLGKSLTVWFNIILGVYSAFAPSFGLPAIPIEILPYAYGGGNIALRFGDKKRLTIKNPHVLSLCFALVGLFMIFAASGLTACTFSADGVSYDDGDTSVQTGKIETSIEPDVVKRE